MAKKKTAKKTVKKSAKKTIKKPAKKSRIKIKASNKRQVNWVLTLIMSIVFGMLGVDRFIMGKVGTGILKLLITIFTFGLLGWIWWIVDIVLIATKHDFEGIEWVD